MLGISSNIETNKLIKVKHFDSIRKIHQSKVSRVLARSLAIFFAAFFLFIFLPWTQNIRSRGYVTTLRPDKRPHNIHSVIPGQIDKWYVQEGDFVNKGDTIVKITEIKDDYFDPQLISRTDQQIKAKESAINSYESKIISLENQTKALKETKRLKISQALNMIKQAVLTIKSDSINLKAAEANYEIAEKQLERIETLFKDGLKSLTDLETRKLKAQETRAKLIGAQNKLLTSQNQLINAKVELNSVENQFNDKLAKVESERFSAISALYAAQAELTQTESKRSNYVIRDQQHYILAPQNGYITRALVTGIGATIKEGAPVISIMPSDYELAVEMYVNPMDLPLLKTGQKVRFMFDGWPSIVFSGWPNASYGTFGGVVVAIDNFMSDNNKYRILVAEDPEDKNPWPVALRVGSGADGMALLKDVPIWYEIWRNLNGFPPDYYSFEPSHNKNSKVKTEKNGSKD